MGYVYVVLGAGRQGAALAFDLALNCEADRVLLLDADGDVARRAVERLERLLPESGTRLTAGPCDISRPEEVGRHLPGADVVLSAVPYRFNLALTDAALAAGASFCDLGGNTQVVRGQLTRHAQATARGVSIVPDCGLAPGLGNILAAHAIALFDRAEHVHIRCGGLPECPLGPLGYKLAFNFDGLANEYSGFGEFLRDGERVNIPALSELEVLEFPPPLGQCEAAVTSGGVSTCAETFHGQVQSLDYKTIRYPGHFAIVRALFGLGLFEPRVTLADGTVLEPRPLLRRLVEDKLAYPEVHDLVVLRCTVTGVQRGRPCVRQYDLFDRQDERTGFTAMERTTAFPTALVAHLQARGLVAPGARPLESSLPLPRYMDELPRHDISVKVTER
jgi:lysine 6-dehydrogenase